MNKRQFNAFDAIGGFETVERLVNAFYIRVQKDPDLRPIFPDDFDEIARKQKKFLTQFLGGPPLYLEEFGPPMLKVKHLPFPITSTRRNAWLNCMSGAMDDIELDGPWREAIFKRLTLAAHHMQNIDD
jgi:hemoglobin